MKLVSADRQVLLSTTGHEINPILDYVDCYAGGSRKQIHTNDKCGSSSFLSPRIGIHLMGNPALRC